MFKYYRHKIGNIVFSRKLKLFKRKKGVFNFESSQKIGIIFKTNSKEEFELVKNFIYYLMEQKNEIIAVGYVNGKKIADYYNTPIGCNFFSKQDLNFFYLPKSPFVLDFMNKSFDILIDLSTEYYLPLDYICSLSQAKFKIGKYSNDHSCYDLMINMGNNGNLLTLIKQIKHYVPIFCKTEV